MYNKLLLILLAPTLLLSCTHSFDGVEDNTPVGNMNCLWRTLDEKYCYFEEKDIDWQATYNHYIQSVRQMDGNDYLALFDTLASMINTLNDGHVNLYSSFDVSSCSGWYTGYKSNFDWNVVKNNYLRDSRKAGGAYYSILTPDSIGYMYVGSFETAVSQSNMAYMLRSMNHCKGLIVDVRNNGGGSLDYAYRLAATFFKDDLTVGYWQHKSGKGHNEFSELEEQRIHKSDMPSSWLRLVVVLCNRHSYSAANFFVSIMRYASNSCVIGDRSGGGGGMPMSYELPNGWLIRFSSIRMFDRDKLSIEDGIAPDIAANDDDKTTTNDEIIETGIKWIKNFYK